MLGPAPNMYVTLPLQLEWKGSFYQTCVVVYDKTAGYDEAADWHLEELNSYCAVQRLKVVSVFNSTGGTVVGLFERLPPPGGDL